VFKIIAFFFYFKADVNGNNYIELSELREALKIVGVDIPGYQARALEEEIKKNDKNKNGRLYVDEFEKLYVKLKSEKDETAFKKNVKPMKDITTVSKNDSIVHTVRHSEQTAFTKWINQ
jgi:hypothetical protein